jgi:hypothetical protein
MKTISKTRLIIPKWKNRIFNIINIGTLKGFSSKFAKTEENANFLLNELNKINLEKNNFTSKDLKSEVNDSSSLNNFIKQKDNILFIDLKSLTNNSLKQTLKYGQFISLNKSFYGQVISINEKYFTVLMITKIDFSTDIKILSIETDFDKKGFVNKHSDYQSLLNNKITSKLVRKYNKRELVEETLLTGQIMIDYINPLVQGTFNLIKGEVNHGQEELLLSIIKAFNGKVILISKNNKFVSELEKEKDYLNDKVEIFLGESMGVYSNTQVSNSKIHNKDEFNLTRNSVIPQLALNKLKELKNFVSVNNRQVVNNSKNNILIIFDDFVDFFFANKTSYVNAELYYPAYNIINEIFEECGNFVNCDVTAVVVRFKFKKYIYNFFSYRTLILLK